MGVLDDAWLSGFIDGEGHVGLHPVRNPGKKVYYSACCSIGNTHYESMVHVGNLLSIMLHRTVKVRYEPRVRGKDSYYTTISAHAELKTLARAVLPYSVTKVQQWNLVLEYVTSRLYASGRKRPYTARELRIIELMSSMNTRWSEGTK